MTKQKSAKRSLLFSVLSLLLCCSMLVGTTFAWFTDSVTSAGNIIKSGTLDVTMEWAYGTEDPATATWNDASQGAIFNYSLWEPGYTEVRHIKISNKGNLALQYQLQIVANGKVSNLADVIDVYYVDPAEQIDERTDLTEDKKLGTLTEALGGMATTAKGNLLAENDPHNTNNDAHEVTLTIALKMQESAGNEYQNLSIGSDFSIILLATQYTHEEDDFGNDYDENATYPAYAVGNGTLTNGATELVIPAMVEGESEPVAIVTIPAAALEEGKTDSQVIVVPTVLDTSVIVANDESAKTFDVSVTNIKEGNTAPITVVLNVDTGLTGVKVYHKDVEITDAVYDSAAGTVTFTTTSFSPFTVVYNVSAASPSTGTEVTTWDELNAVVAEGGHAVLMNDISGATTINLNGGTIDGNGYTLTYSNTGRGAVMMNPTGGTIKNAKLVNSNTSWVGQQYAIGSNQFATTTLTEDLNIDNVTISNFDLAIDLNANGHNVFVKKSEISNNVQVGNAGVTSFEACHLMSDNATKTSTSSHQGILFLLGDMTFTDCHFEETVNFYLDSTRYSGTVKFNNSTYGNNGVENRPIESFGFITYWFGAFGVINYPGTFGETKPAQTHFNWYINGELVWDATAI